MILENQEWVARRSEWAPGDDVRNVERHTEQYWASPTGMQLGAPGAGEMPGFPGTGGMPGLPGAGGMPGASVSPTQTELSTRVYYTYEALEWQKGRSLTASGTDQADVRWPDYTLAPQERVRSTRESYSAAFTADDKHYETTLPEQQWRALPPGGSCQLTLGMLGGVKKVAPAGT